MTKPATWRPPRLHVHLIDAVIADERIGHRDDLGFVGRVGEDFLVAGHGSVEADLAARGGVRAEALSVKTRNRLQGPGLLSFSLTTARDARRVIQWVKREANFHAATLRLFRPDLFAADDGGHRPPLEFPAEEGAVGRFARGFGTVKIHSRSGSKMVTSASAPTASVPLGKFSSRAG